MASDVRCAGEGDAAPNRSGHWEEKMTPGLRFEESMKFIRRGRLLPL
jgi:hypothetical protein